MTDKPSQYRFDSLDLAVYIWKKKIPLLVITVAAAIVSIIGSYMITPKFKSTAILFPTASPSIGKSLLQAGYTGNIQAVGEEEHVETVIQVLKSDKIRDKITARYGLMEHYKIDPNGAHPFYELHKYYASNVRIRRTEYNSIEISVLDEEPELAACMANDIASLADTVIWEIKKTSAQKAAEYIKATMDSYYDKLKEHQECIYGFNKKGIINYDRQIERLVEAYGKAVIEGNDDAIEAIQKEVDLIAEYSSEFIHCWSAYTREISHYYFLKTQYDQVMADMNSDLPAVFILDKAQVADKKVYPKKSIIVIIATLSAFVLALISFLFFENFIKKLKSE